MYDLRSKTIFFRDITLPSSRLFPPAVSPPPCAFMIAPNFGKKDLWETKKGLFWVC